MLLAYLLTLRHLPFSWLANPQTRKPANPRKPGLWYTKSPLFSSKPMCGTNIKLLSLRIIGFAFYTLKHVQLLCKLENKNVLIVSFK